MSETYTIGNRPSEIYDLGQESRDDEVEQLLAVNARLVARTKALLSAAKEAHDGFAVACAVLANHGLVAEFTSAANCAGVKDGVGKRLDEAIIAVEMWQR